MNYGKRRIVEIFLSTLKRVAEEIIRGRKFAYQIQDAVIKIYSYFILR